jgi:leucyl/phenylalanyl-tRNA--protein transferase
MNPFFAGLGKVLQGYAPPAPAGKSRPTRRAEWKPVFFEDMGLVAVGGDLHPQRLLYGYRHGIFPWFDEGDPILWWSPDPRAIFELDGLHVSRRLQRTLRSDRFAVTVNRDFAGVIRGCADRAEGTWITSDVIAAYEVLHHRGDAHSVEVWHAGQLAGGVYGVAVGALFAGESMFTRVRDASKVALAHLITRLRERGFQLFDIQFRTAHTEWMGAVEIPRADYLARLAKALRVRPRFDTP